MKKNLITVSAVALIFCSASCRYSVPVNPNTGELDPGRIPQGNTCIGIYHLEEK